ncbi:hypothetical protein B0O99DRAFT_523077 [Bisporella sp. PMI_857]|nr:hypothetical protein B0O99DRAFT_523077 [Bisporella sp. PMI_857]
MYRLRRVKEIFRDIEVPPPSPTEKSPYIDLEDNPYDYSRATCYINSQDSQYVDSRDNRGTTTHYPGYSPRGYDLEIRNPFVPAPSDKYPISNLNSSSHDSTKGYQVPPGAESGEKFSFSNREAIFADFLRGQGGMGDLNGAENRDGEGIKPHPSRLHTPGVTAIERTVQLTLEQLFEGTQKMKKVGWKKFDRDAGQMTPYKDNVGSVIKLGFRKGTRVIFRDVGDLKEELHLIIDEKPHPVFTRDGDDLHMTIELSLFESLCGWKASVFTIDGKLLDIEKKNPTQPGSHDSYPELGMPSSEARDKRGRFIIHYAVKYPAWLTRREISGLKEILGPKIYT